MNVTAADWGVLLLIVLALFVLDLVLATRRSHAVGFREAAGWSVFFVTMAAGSAWPSSAWRGRGYAAQFFAGDIVEKSLSADNLFASWSSCRPSGCPASTSSGC